VFGLSFGEILVLAVVAIVVVGPRNLPSMMRTAGQWVSRIRRMSTDLRAQSGIDTLMREEGIDQSIREIRAISNVNVLEHLENLAAPAATATAAATAKAATSSPVIPPLEREEVLREREYPLVGCDAYDALPDDAAPYGAVATSDPMSYGAEKDPSASS
jgi:sec-independent protein translocase protein TatB